MYEGEEKRCRRDGVASFSGFSTLFGRLFFLRFHLRFPPSFAFSLQLRPPVFRRISG